MLNQNIISNQEKFINIWLNLSPKQRKSRIIRAYGVIRKMADEQIQILDTYEKQPNEKNVGFLYFINTVKEIWRHADFAIHLGKGKNKKFSFYPVRTILENTLRLKHYIHQKKEKQDELALKEFMRICKRFYDYAKTNGAEDKEMTGFYNEFASWGNSPKDIKLFNANDKVFPNIRQLADEGFGSRGDTWYFFFQYLAESTHGNLMSIIISNNNEKAEHNRTMVMMLMICYEALLIVDLHMGKINNTKVIESIKRAESIMKKC